MTELTTNMNSKTPAAGGGSWGDNCSPITVHMADTIGAIFLGITTIALFIALRRSEARTRALAAQLAAQQG